jgi:hypothetical protein
MMKKAQDTYYALMGWDEGGIPTEESMKKYGPDFVTKDEKIPCKSGRLCFAAAR